MTGKKAAKEIKVLLDKLQEEITVARFSGETNDDLIKLYRLGVRLQVDAEALLNQVK